MENNAENMTALVVDDAEIEYSVHGNGEPVVLVHAGGFADWFAAMAASRALDGLRIIRVRRAGYGPNVPNHSLTIKDHARHLAALAAHMGCRPFHLVGHSSGGLIALQLASDYPDLVHSLMLLEPAPCGPLQAPAFAELATKSVGPAMAAFASGNCETAFDLFMGGVCDQAYREVIEQRLGRLGYDQALRESNYFFRDEAPAAMAWQFSSADAARI